MFDHALHVHRPAWQVILTGFGFAAELLAPLAGAGVSAEPAGDTPSSRGAEADRAAQEARDKRDVRVSIHSSDAANPALAKCRRGPAGAV